MRRWLIVQGSLLILSAILVIHSTPVLPALQTAADPKYVASVRQARREIALFDRSGKTAESPDPRRRWADYFWTYYQGHLDFMEGSQAAGRTLRLLVELKAYQEVIAKSQAIDPQNPAWVHGAIYALADAYLRLDRFRDFFERAEGLLGLTLDAHVRAATAWALAKAYLDRKEFDKALPLLEAIVVEDSNPNLRRAAQKEICALPFSKDANGGRAARDSWQKPEQVLTALGVRRGSAVADIGAGEGYFTFRLAEAVKPQGKVFAVEINPATIARLQYESRHRQLKNVTVLRGTEGDPRLPKGSCHVVLFVDAYHEVGDRPSMLRHVKRALKRGGLLAIIDEYRPGREDHYLSEETVLAEVAAAGYKLVRQETFLPAQFMLVFRK